jgi:hypothetical protein
MWLDRSFPDRKVGRDAAMLAPRASHRCSTCEFWNRGRKVLHPDGWYEASCLCPTSPCFRTRQRGSERCSAWSRRLKSAVYETDWISAERP